MTSCGRKSRQAGSEPLAAEPENEIRCEVEKNEEILKFRQHQYQENPGMMIDGDDVKMVMDCDHCGPAVQNVCWMTVEQVG